MGKCVLLPLDGSRVAEAAVPHAVAMSKALGAGLVLLRVVEPPANWPAYETPPPASELTQHEERRCAAAMDYLKIVKQRLERECVTARAQVEVGLPTYSILACAQATGAGLIVMATRGRSLLAKLLLGSVTDEVVRSGVIPVLVVRAGKRPRLVDTKYVATLEAKGNPQGF